MAVTTMVSAVDAQVRESQPSLNYGQTVNLSVNGGGGSNDRFSYIAFPVLNVIPIGATIISASLKVYLKKAWAGTNNLSVKRVTEKWKENTVNWNNKPAVDATPAATAVVSAGVDKQEVSFNVQPILQEVADGGKFFGFRIELTEDVSRQLRSAEDPDSTLRPRLEIEWSEAPETPDRLIPDEQVVGAIGENGMPRLRWRFTDRAGNTQQSAFQVQVDDLPDFVSPTHDSGKVSSDLAEYVPGSSVIADGQTRYWRVRVYDGADLVSPWSEVAVMTRDDQGTLTITSPAGSTVPETTPPIVWSLTGETQERYKLVVLDITGSVPVTVYDSGVKFSSTTSHTIPPDVLKTGQTYSVQVSVWDTENRVGDAGQVVTKQITYVRDGTPNPVTALTAVATPGSAEVVLDFTRSVAPDFFALKVDGVEVEGYTRIEPVDVLVSGSNYRIRYWLAKPRVLTTYEVEAVVQTGGGSNPFQHSDANATATATTDPVGIWLADWENSVGVQVLGREAQDLELGEQAATYSPIGSRVQVRIEDTTRGYEGAVQGVVIGATARDSFLALKSARKQLQLVIGNLAIPITMESAFAAPTPVPGDVAFEVGFNFFQSGPPWPVTKV